MLPILNLKMSGLISVKVKYETVLILAHIFRILVKRQLHHAFFIVSRRNTIHKLVFYQVCFGQTGPGFQTLYLPSLIDRRILDHLL